jgi:hypothetical protein
MRLALAVIDRPTWRGVARFGLASVGRPDGVETLDGPLFDAPAKQTLDADQ